MRIAYSILGFASLAALLAPVPAIAECEVIFFGGKNANKADMDRCFPGFTNYGMAQWSSGQSEAAKKINGDTSGKCFVLVGHSSGAHFASAAAAGVNNDHAKKVYLVDLDGEAPSGALIGKLAAVKCVNAKTGSQNSYNFSVANNCPAANRTTFSYPNAGKGDNVYPHFIMVNPDAPTSLTWGNYSSDAFKNCSAKNPLIPALKNPPTGDKVDAQSWNLCGEHCGK